MKHKKIFNALALAVFVAAVAIAPLQAAPDCGKPGCPKKGDQEKMKGKDCMMKAEGCMMLKSIPSLTDEQKAKLEKLHAEHQKLMAAAKADMEKLHAEMQGLMKDPVDVKKAEAKIDELAKFRAGMMKKHLAQRLAVRALLTDEQKAKLPAMAGCLAGGGMAGAMAGGCGHMAKAAGCGKGEMKKECCSKGEMKKEGCGHQHGQEKAGCAAKPECQKEAEKKTP